METSEGMSSSLVFLLIFATCAHIDPLFVNVRVTCKEKRLKEKLLHQINANILQWYLNLNNEMLLYYERCKIFTTKL